MRRINTFVGLTLGCFLAFGSVGCFGGDGGGGGGGDDCTADADCDDNTQRCTADNACVSKCADIICSTGQTCEPTTGACAGGGGCTVDADCNDATQRCDTGTSACVSKCAGVICSGTQTCEATTGNCTGGGGGCASDADCDPQGDLGVICDAGTCKGDVYGDCANNECVTGLTCLTVEYSTGPDSSCYLPCADSSLCALGEWCIAETGHPMLGHCTSNLCGPALAQYGYQGSAMMTTCDATVSGAADGVCVGPLADQGDASTPLEIGLCFATGSVAAGGTCAADAANGETANLCNNGMCLVDTQGAATGNCREFCSILDGTDCAGAFACTPLGGLAGVCTPQAANPIAAGQTCTPSTTEEVCVEDSLCADPNGGTANTCLAFCDTRVGTCASGTCTATSASPYDPFGICI